ncbi:MAG: glycosyltransferase family 39 protein [Proteobacteria bacterium]|nr:glycosyltransferase family 39 protein [Pseudomonadota bacterium]
MTRSAFGISWNQAAALVGACTLLRVIVAWYLPLSFDEAYFWLWSKHLAIAYYDHPPMIALAIRLGTLLFGDSEFGVRFVSLMASVAASWAVWRSATILLADELAAITACCLFNITLMVASESMSATPDALMLGASALLLLTLVKLEQTGNGRWWLAAGLALGFALLTKYTALFLVAGCGLWTIMTPQGRRWFRSPWLYAAGAIALGSMVSTLLWNAAHDWISFKFQFGRVVNGAIGVRFLGEFIASQIALATPFVFVLGYAGLARGLAKWRQSGALAITVWICVPAVVYFLTHALHDRVQGNWPSFIYPALAILAVSIVPNSFGEGAWGKLLWISQRLAIPAALAVLAISYAQAFFGVLPLGIHDPVARMTAVGITPVMDKISALARENHAAAIVTNKYVTTGWISFYAKPRLPVVQITEDYRWLSEPHADAALLSQPLIYVSETPAIPGTPVTQEFANIKFLGKFDRERSGKTIDSFYVYAVSGLRGAPTGRVS